MINLDNFIYNINVGSTNNNIDIRSYVNFINNKDELSLDNCISIKDMVSNFNDKYQEFINDYNNLVNLDICKDIKMAYYSEDSNYNFRLLSLDAIDLVNPINGYDTLELLMYQCDSEYSAKLINNASNKIISKLVNIDENIIKSYLDFGEKYSDVIDAYSKLKNGQLCGIGSSSIYTYFFDMEEKDNRIKVYPKAINELDHFGIAVVSSDFNNEEYVDLEFGLNDNVGKIKVNKCNFKGNKKSLSEEEVSLVIDNIYVNRDKLPKLYSNECVKKLEKRM